MVDDETVEAYDDRLQQEGMPALGGVLLAMLGWRLVHPLGSRTGRRRRR